jgi:hypothetical protein
MTLTKEKTLIFDRNLCIKHIGFRSPLPVRLRLYWKGLMGQMLALRLQGADGLIIKGWVEEKTGAEFVTYVGMHVPHLVRAIYRSDKDNE